jgi:hypothetical protein
MNAERVVVHERIESWGVTIIAFRRSSRVCDPELDLALGLPPLRGVLLSGHRATLADDPD